MFTAALSPQHYLSASLVRLKWIFSKIINIMYIQNQCLMLALAALSPCLQSQRRGFTSRSTARVILG